MIYFLTPPKKNGDMETLTVYEDGRVKCTCLKGYKNKGMCQDLRDLEGFPKISDCSHAVSFIENIDMLEEAGYTEINCG